MEKRFLAAVLALGIMAALAPPARGKPQSHARTKQYATEHRARIHRHRAHQPAQRHARMQRYAAEHRARQHRHRAHLKAHRHGH